MKTFLIDKDYLALCNGSSEAEKKKKKKKKTVKKEGEVEIKVTERNQEYDINKTEPTYVLEAN